MKRKLFILTVLACVLGCAPEHEPDAAFLEQDCLALEVEGARKVLYEPETWQLGFSRENKQFRVHNDMMSEYYVVTCSAIPDFVGQKIICSVKYASYKMTVYKSSLAFEVKKINDEGVVWLDRQDIEIKNRLVLFAGQPVSGYMSILLPDELEADVHRNAASVHVGDVC